MAHVRLENVRKVYPNGFEAVANASFEVPDGDFVVFVGPSGCGKSTLLRMIAGLEEVTDGTIKIGERVVNDVSPKDRDIAMVFQNYALYPHMSIYENLAFGLRVRKFPKGEIDQRVRDAAGILGLAEVLDRKPKQLSGGQRQRVAVGRAIVRKPQVFLFDEPLSNLDAKLRVQMRTEISKLHNRLGTTMIYVTHDQVEAMTMGDRIVVLRDGEVQQIAAPLELYQQPANRFVAGFIGSPAMNFVSGELTRQGTGLEFSADGGVFDLPLPADAATQLEDAIGRRVVMGVRPEHVTVPADAGGSSPLASIGSWKVDVVEPMGNEVILYSSWGTNGVAHNLIARMSPRVLPTPGARIDLFVDPRKLNFFDAESEASLRHGSLVDA